MSDDWKNEWNDQNCDYDASTDLSQWREDKGNIQKTWRYGRCNKTLCGLRNAC